MVKDKDGLYMDCILVVESLRRNFKNARQGRFDFYRSDEQAIEFCKKRLEAHGPKWKVFKSNFENLDIVAYKAGIDKLMPYLWI